MLITDEYRQINIKLHESNIGYGTSGGKWASNVLDLAQFIDSQDILDYGCGKSTLANNLPFNINQYDPAIYKYSSPPDPADIVICLNVLECVEPDLISNVLADICRLTKKVALLSITNGVAQRNLADGRNAHLIQENDMWWLSHILPIFNLLHFAVDPFSIGARDNHMLQYVLTVSPRIKL